MTLEWSSNQFLPRATSQRLHLLVHVGDDAERIGGHQRIDIRLDQRARVELRGLQLALELFLRGNVPCGSEDPADTALGVAKDGRVERHRDLLSPGGLKGQNIVGNRALFESE